MLKFGGKDKRSALLESPVFHALLNIAVELLKGNTEEAERIWKVNNTLILTKYLIMLLKDTRDYNDTQVMLMQNRKPEFTQLRILSPQFSPRLRVY